MTKDEALNQVRIAAYNVHAAHGARLSTKEDHVRKTRALAVAETQAIMAGATATEVAEAAL